MNISVCVVTYQRPSHVKRLLRSLGKQDSPPHEIIIVDDSDTDAVERVVDSHSEQVEQSCGKLLYRRRQQGSGMTDARNDAIERASGEIVAFLDDDVELPTDWVSSLRDLWNEFPESGAIGGPALLVDEHGEYPDGITRTDENLNWLNRYGEGRSREADWLPDEPVETDQLGGANMSFRRSVLEDMGKFNAIYQGSEMYEDTDVMARLRRREKTIRYCPSIAVKHYETEKVGAQSDREAIYWWGWNMMVFRYVCFPETFPVAVFRLPFTTWWRRIGRAVLDDPDHLYMLKGNVDGIRYAMSNRESLPVDTR